MYGVLAAIAVLIVLWTMRQAGRLPVAKQRQFTKQAVGYALCAAGAFFALKGLLVIAVPLFGVGAGILGFQSLFSQKPASASSPQTIMPKDEALAVLGLNPNATVEDIRAAHKSLLRGLHPDTGGSNYLAAKINAARDVLLK